MHADIVNLVLIIGICFIGYIFLIRLNIIEGLANRPSKSSSDSSSDTSTDTSKPSRPSNGSSSGSSANGIAGNAATYAANLKAASVKIGDTLLISKYRSDYESAIMNAEELVNNLLLKTVLTLNPSDPKDTIKELVALSHAQAALNIVMKFVDSQ